MPISSPVSKLATLAVLAVLLALGSTTAHAQADPCETIQGTIQVADDAPNKQELAKITPEQAGEAAVAALPGATVRDTDLEEEDGYLVYEVDLDLSGQEHDAYVDAGSGAVLCTEPED